MCKNFFENCADIISLKFWNIFLCSRFSKISPQLFQNFFVFQNTYKVLPEFLKNYSCKFFKNLKFCLKDICKNLFLKLFCFFPEILEKFSMFTYIILKFTFLKNIAKIASKFSCFFQIFPTFFRNFSKISRVVLLKKIQA